MSKFEYCRTCKNRKFDPKSGILCGLTSVEESQGRCSGYVADELLVKKEVRSEIKANSEEAEKTGSTATIISIVVVVFFVLLAFLFPDSIRAIRIILLVGSIIVYLVNRFSK